MPQKSLGRGLGALLPESDSRRVAWVRPEEILANPLQPRQKFDRVTMAELIQSIKDRGVIQPLLVRRVETGYEVIAGERRLRAAREAGMSEIPVIIRESDHRESLELSIIENVQRDDLNPIEEARAYQRLLQEFQLTQEQIAEKVRKDRSTVANLLRLLALPEKILGYIQDGFLTVGHARALLGFDNKSMQHQIAGDIIAKSLSVRQVEELVRGRNRESKRTATGGRTSPFLQKLATDLQRLFSTKVRIHGSEQGRGKIEIEYYSRADLERILSVLNRDE